MKTIKNSTTNEIRRVTNNNAKMLTDMIYLKPAGYTDYPHVEYTPLWIYIPKEVWKAEVRDKLPDKQTQE